jgi:hypothetical protein
MTLAPSIIPTPGIHHGVPNEEYHQWKALSHSWMGRLRVTPAHLLDLMDNGGNESTPAMMVGSAVHCAVLEPAEYESRYAAYPEGCNGTTKEGKAFKANMDAAGITVLSLKDGRLVSAIAWRAKMCQRLQEWLHRDHACEVALCWERSGFLCKAKLDLMVPGLNILVDLKTTIVGSEAGFAGQVARYGYHLQAAWYLDGIQRLTGQVWDWQFAVCEKRRPYLVNCQAMPRESAAHLKAVAENDRLFELYCVCMQTGQWPGHPDVDEIKLPEWALGDGSPVPEDEPFE